jgi:excisionase family DNA binding protein
VVKKYYTVDEAAEYLGTGVRFVRRIIAERRIPFHKVGKFVRLRIDDLEAFAAAGRVEAFDPAAVRRHVRRAS